MSPSELTNTIELFIVYVNRNEAHFTYIYHFYLFIYFCIIFLHTNLPYFVKRPRAIVIDWALYKYFYYYYYYYYIIPMYLRLTTFTKTLPQMSFHLYFFLFLFRSGAPPMTLLTAGALTDPRLPATTSNVCTTDARLGGVGRVPPPPKQKSWLRRCLGMDIAKYNKPLNTTGGISGGF